MSVWTGDHLFVGFEGGWGLWTDDFRDAYGWRWHRQAPGRWAPLPAAA
ncbi:hypothetical protein [Kibdelosporangium philippinense]